MIQLALSIAAFLFLCWVGIMAIALIGLIIGSIFSGIGEVLGIVDDLIYRVSTPISDWVSNQKNYVIKLIKG